MEKKTQKNIKVVSQIRIGDWILERIRSYKKDEDSISSSSGSVDGKKKSKKAKKSKNSKNSKKGSKKRK